MKMTPREEILNRSILTHTRLIASRRGGWAPASTVLLAAVDDDGVDADETLFCKLLTFLIELGLIAEKASEPFALGKGDLRHRQIQLTDLGYRLWAGQIDPIPGIADRRVD